jgi:hypothetical protein
VKNKDTITYWKKRAWDEFTKFIKIRDALNSTGNKERVKCCTCNTEYPVKGMHGGHFNPGRHNSILFEERGVHAQCYYCNIQRRGAPREYDKFMKIRYGQEVIDELDLKADETKIMKWFDYKEIYEKYKLLNEGEF